MGMKPSAIAVGVLILFPSLACAQVRADPRKAVLDALVVRGDQAMTNGLREQASAAWSLVLAFEPTHADAKKKLDALPGAGFSASSEEVSFASSAVSKTGSGDWCGFPEPTPEMEITAIRMLGDNRLLPSLRSTSMSFNSGDCSGFGAFVFLARPAISMADVRLRYGTPETERKEAWGEILTYGRFRVVGGKDGSAELVIFPPFKK